MERREYEEMLALALVKVEEMSEKIHEVYELDIPAIKRRPLLEAAHSAAAAAGKEVERLEAAWAEQGLAERLEYVAALERRLK